MRFSNKKILDLSAVIADAYSETINLEHLYGVSFQIKWTSSTAAGTIKVEASNDEETWVNIAAHNQTINNDDGDVLVNISDVFYKSIRIFVDFSSGSITTVDVIMNAKGF